MTYHISPTSSFILPDTHASPSIPSPTNWFLFSESHNYLILIKVQQYIVPVAYLMQLCLRMSPSLHFVTNVITYNNTSCSAVTLSVQPSSDVIKTWHFYFTYSTFYCFNSTVFRFFTLLTHVMFTNLSPTLLA